jgi:hypothetical protein
VVTVCHQVSQELQFFGLVVVEVVLLVGQQMEEMVEVVTAVEVVLVPRLVLLV